jgi:hypothetical protein
MRNTAATSSLKLSGLATLGAAGHLTKMKAGSVAGSCSWISILSDRVT